jgi:serine/threonine protein kinase
MVDAVEGTPNLDGLEGAERAVLLRALSKTPEDRYPSCLAFVAALQTAIKGELAGPRPPTQETWLQPMRRVGPDGHQLLHRLTIYGGVGEFWETVAPGGKHVGLQVIANLDRRGVLKHLHAYDLARCLAGASHVLQVHGKWLANLAGEVHPEAEVYKQEWKGPGTLVIATELADDDLARRLGDSRRKLSDERLGQLLKFLKQAALAIDHINSRQHAYARRQVAIRHCAIRPENIRLIGGEVRIADFGLAQEATEPCEPLRADGIDLEPGYAAPELLERGGGRVTATSDQYSLAMTYVKLRTGTLPFEQSQSRHRIIGHQLAGELNFQALPEAEQAIIARATARKPEDRYPSCADLIAALEEVSRVSLGDAAVDAPEPAGTPEKKQPAHRPFIQKPTPGYGIARQSKGQQGRQTDRILLPGRDPAEKTDSEFELHVPVVEVGRPKKDKKPSQKPSRSRWLTRVLTGVVALLGIGLVFYVVAGGLIRTDNPGKQVVSPEEDLPPPPPPPPNKPLLPKEKELKN